MVVGLKVNWLNDYLARKDCCEIVQLSIGYMTVWSASCYYCDPEK